MCGIVGILAAHPHPRNLLDAAIKALRHRGPDDSGGWVSEDGTVHLGHTRLAIQDLSAAGRQPMVSRGERFVLVFNGEIYNHLEIRSALAAESRAPVWSGHSDTETLLAAIEAWGLEPTLARCRGMWAFALWDRASRRLSLVRDRFGEKPLYYGRVNGGVAFASELKALKALPGFSAQIDPASIDLLLRLGYIPAPASIYSGIRKLLPGSIVTVAPGGAPSEPQCYYDYVAELIAGSATPIADPDKATGALFDRLSETVRRQLVADVPVGTFLSGGIDSSLITALAVRSGARVQTFSIGFAQAGFDEAPYARAVAAHLGTEHHELYVGPVEAQAVIPQLPTLYDEPFGDYSQIPTYLVSRFARQQVTVALSGDGGDELFGGYNRHRAIPAAWSRIAGIPPAWRKPLLGPAAAIPPAAWNLALRLFSGQRRPDFLGEKVQRLLRIGSASASFPAFALAFLEQDANGIAPPAFARHFNRLAELPPPAQLMALDTLTYLPDDILVKVDRAAMGVSLEGRIPFLDPEVVALSTRIPLAMKIGKRGGKHILREILADLVPTRLFERPKAGFTMPVGAWLRTDLRGWAEALLNPAESRSAIYGDISRYYRYWSEHQAGKADHSEQLWRLLMLEAWLRLE